MQPQQLFMSCACYCLLMLLSSVVQIDVLSTPTSRPKGAGLITPMPRRFQAADQVRTQSANVHDSKSLGSRPACELFCAGNLLSVLLFILLLFLVGDSVHRT